MRIEFSGDGHPVGRVVQAGLNRVVDETTRLITAGRRRGSIPPGPPATKLALALTGAVEGAIIRVAGQAPRDRGDRGAGDARHPGTRAGTAVTDLYAQESAKLVLEFKDQRAGVAA
jgi:hypothetical protein